jgi:parallel beta-helix repeat protein
MKARILSRASVFGGIAAVAALVLAAGPAGAAGSKTLWAAPDGSGSACTASQPCALADAVAAAGEGATVRAKPGIYSGGVSITKPITLVGGGHATIDAASSPTGMGIDVTSGGSGSTVSGFTVEHALYEGILVGDPLFDAAGAFMPAGSPVSDVTIEHNVVVANDTGFTGGSGLGQCDTPPNAPPGDCGEGIHLLSVADSVVAHNRVSGNAGGILLTDERGPTTGNLIDHNVVVDNVDDCGITIASHTPAGIWGNTVQHNTVDGNGVAGEGAGILLAGGGPFTAVHDNVIRDNEASGNGLSGVTIHQHFAANLNNNVIENNHLGNNNLDGDRDFYQAADTETTDILVASGSPFPGAPFPPGPITGTVIRNNQLGDATFGIWLLNVDPSTTTIAHNHYGPHLAVPVSTNP